uniref:CinA-like protein n=1 Tax=mine drainage metagenome TaxID=410659 RepID=E6PC64_9ZZZZ
MSSVELVAVGTELLLGQLVDTNSSYVAAALAENGIDCYASHAVGDNRERIAALFREILDRADGAISTGGLGPTVDDLTKEAVADALGLALELDRDALAEIEGFFASIGRTMRDNNRKQAYLPVGSVPLPNPHGTAPGFVALRADGKFVACMPGVPREMKPMLAERLLPWLRSRFNVRDGILTRVLHTVNIGESEIDHRIADLFASSENPKIAVLAHDYRCDVKIMAKAASSESARMAIAPLEAELRSRLHGRIFGIDAMTLEGAVLAALDEREESLAVAESCTGGRIAAAITAVPGASRRFLGGIVAYDNAVKQRQLGVPEQTLARFGAVSEESALAMARGVRAGLRAQIGLATTGIAGPEGGSPEKPLGTLCVAIADARGERAWTLHLRGDRAAIQARATTAALGLLWREIKIP